MVMSETTQRRLAAIVLVDAVGYSRLMGTDEVGTLSALSEHRKELIDPLISKNRGRIVKTMGDGLLLEFPSVVDAVTCAVTIQDGMLERNADVLENKRIKFRIGINLGDIIIDGDDIHGDGVNVAARLQEIAKPGGIAISRRVHEDVRDRLDIAFEDSGEQQLRNISRPVHVLGWVPDKDAAVDDAKFVGEAVSPPDKPSIAVLPFENVSGEPEQEYFADGVTEDIITRLTKFRQFLVISRNSTFTYKGLSVDAKTLANELGARYVLEGSVRKSGDRLRITAQLVDARKDSHVWADHYDRNLDDMFSVQDDIAECIIANVAPEFLSAEMHRARRKEERNLDAWDAYMRGYWHLLRYTKNDNVLAKTWLGKAIQLDPVQAHFHSLLAVAHAIDHLYGWCGDPVETLGLAMTSAERGLAVGEQDPAVIRSLGIVHFHARNHEAARGYFEQAAALNPDDAETRALLGSAQAVAGDYDGAVAQIEHAIRLSPRDAHIATWYNFLAIAAVVDGRDELAVTWAKKAVQANPQLPAGYRTLASCCGNLDRNDEAAAACRKLQELLPELTVGQLRARLPYFQKSKDLERYLDGLSKAGLPN